MKKICEACAKEYTTKKGTQRFCSRECGYEVLRGGERRTNESIQQENARLKAENERLRTLLTVSGIPL